jgi:hypothetical protein
MFSCALKEHPTSAVAIILKLVSAVGLGVANDDVIGEIDKIVKEIIDMIKNNTLQ